ncbi:MAG: CADD family putative folate metabolism protein [Deltaproteobacteria bacterium]|nr:CADD family putative folate metabolism protein [Deltaproteobacteria bacterium]
MSKTSIETVALLDTHIQERHLLTHPFYRSWSAGTLSLRALQEYSKQYYRHVEAFPTYVSAVHANCPSLPIRQHLLENLIDEERGTENHPELWLRFAEALGVQRDDVLSAAPLPQTTALVQTFRTLTRESSYLAGTVALLAYEAQVPEVAEAKIAGLRQFYRVNDQRGLAFFQVHLQADRCHAETARRILREQITPENTDEVVTAGEHALAALWGMLDGVSARYC